MLVKNNNSRIIYLDILRIAATVAVVMIHLASHNLVEEEIGTFEWDVYNFF